ncbi:MAG TPA: hypothetical protein VLT33_36805, partial [Labilithrix sp.]|nr:hypothetical protein [Labilithrix sp.]
KDDPEPIEPVAPKPIVPDPAADLCTSAQATLEVSADGRSAVLGGEKAKCLAVSLGSFRSLSSKGAVTEIVCPESGRCVFKIPSASAATLQGSAATRLFTALRVTPTAGVKSFEAKDGAKAIKVECTTKKRCTVSITKG